MTPIQRRLKVQRRVRKAFLDLRIVNRGDAPIDFVDFLWDDVHREDAVTLSEKDGQR